jgi:hypothetical protein
MDDKRGAARRDADASRGDEQAKATAEHLDRVVDHLGGEEEAAGHRGDHQLQEKLAVVRARRVDERRRRGGTWKTSNKIQSKTLMIAVEILYCFSDIFLRLI